MRGLEKRHKHKTRQGVLPQKASMRAYRLFLDRNTDRAQCSWEVSGPLLQHLRTLSREQLGQLARILSKGYSVHLRTLQQQSQTRTSDMPSHCFFPLRHSPSGRTR
jgi:hypothetical protein